MGLFSRVKRLEDDMFQRKIDEKLEEYSNKYKIKVSVRPNFWDCWYVYDLLIDEVKIKHLFANHSQKELLYDELCKCEDAIKIYLFDEMWGKENAQTD